MSDQQLIETLLRNIELAVILMKQNQTLQAYNMLQKTLIDISNLSEVRPIVVK